MLAGRRCGIGQQPNPLIAVVPGIEPQGYLGTRTQQSALAIGARSRGQIAGSLGGTNSSHPGIAKLPKGSLLKPTGRVGWRRAFATNATQAFPFSPKVA